MTGDPISTDALLASVLRITPDAAVALDAEGRVTEWNARAEELFGWTAGEAIGRKVSELIVPPAHREGHEAGLRRALAQARVRWDVAPVPIVGLHKDGHEVPIELVASPIQGADPHRFLAFLRDARRVRDAEREAAEARASAESALRTKALFLSEMAHELRTPLNAIAGYTDLLLETAADASHPDLERIRTAAAQLLKLVERILDYSRIEEGKAELFPEVFDVSDLAYDVVSQATPIAARNRNRIEVATTPGVGTMHGDANRVRQCLSHLVTNAANCMEDGLVVLGIRRARRGGQEWVVLTVKDDGPGMEPQEVGLLFQPFSHAGATTTRRYGGAGLGLAISRRLCRLMGGDLTVWSEPGKGSVFTMELPARTVTPGAEDVPSGSWDDPTRT